MWRGRREEARLSSIISVSGLSKTYAGGFQALKGVDLEIRRGEIFALLGPNGAGKTTLISIICGIVRASSGNVLADGHDIVREYRQARSKIGLVPQELNTDAFESVWDTVKFSRGLFGMAAFTVPAALAQSTAVAVGCIALAVFCCNVATANAWALATAVAPPAYVASLGAIQNFGGYFGGSFAPVITGKVVEVTGSFTPAFLVGAAVAALAAVIYLALVRSPISAESLEG